MYRAIWRWLSHDTQCPSLSTAGGASLAARESAAACVAHGPAALARASSCTTTCAPGVQVQVRANGLRAHATTQGSGEATEEELQRKLQWTSCPWLRCLVALLGNGGSSARLACRCTGSFTASTLVPVPSHPQTKTGCVLVEQILVRTGTSHRDLSQLPSQVLVLPSSSRYCRFIPLYILVSYSTYLGREARRRNGHSRLVPRSIAMHASRCWSWSSCEAFRTVTGIGRVSNGQRLQRDEHCYCACTLYAYGT